MALATFPGRNGIIALPDNHIPYVIGIERITPDGHQHGFLFGCKVDTSKSSEPCLDGSAAPSGVGRPSFSRDGRTVVFSDGLQLGLVGSDGKRLRRLPQLTHGDANPTWFPNDRVVAFTGTLSATDGSKTAIFSVHVDGTALRRLSTNGDDAAVSAGGHLIAFDRPARGRRDLWVMRSDGSHLHRLAVNGSNPCFSPNGRQIVFASVVHSKRSIERLDLTGRNRRTIARYGDFPAWSPDGKRIAYSVTAPNNTGRHLAELWMIPAGGGRRTLLAFDDPVSEDVPEFGVPDWQALGH